MLLKTVNLRAFLTAAIERNKRISHAPTRVNFSAFDFAVLTAICCHLVCKNCVIPFSFHQHMQATRKQISISFIIDYIIADELEKLDVADDYEVQVEIPYTIIYNAANDVAVHRLPKKKYYSLTYCNRVRKVVHGLLDELKDLGFSPSGKNISIIYVGGITSLQKLVFSGTRLSFEEYQLGTLLILVPQLKIENF